MKQKISFRLARFSLIYLTTLLSLLDWINAANIIAFLPFELKSSTIFSEAIVKTLVNAGHDVTYVTAIPFNEYSTNCTVIDFQSDTTRIVISPANSFFEFRWSYGLRATVIQKEKLCFSDAVKKSLNRLMALQKKFDLLIIPLTFYPKCLLPIAQKFGIPYVGFNIMPSFLYSDLMVGNPRNIASTPFDFSIFYEERTFWTRLWDTMDHFAWMYFIINPYYNVIHDSRFKSQFPNFDIDHMPKMSLVFNNNHQSIYPRPLSPNTIEVGGLHISKTAKELPQHIKTFLDEGENGVILFSLGTVVQSNILDDEKRRILLNVFAKIPERVIWKFSEDLPNLPANVLITKWIPQRDVLAHKNVKAFITHCGFFGIQEAVYEGKPLIMIPMNADQPGNAALMYQKEVGEYLELKSLTEEKLYKTIRRVIDNKKYRENMEKLSAAYKDRPMTPQETLIYWTEYVLRHKGAMHLQTAAIDMPFYQYFLLDVILFLFIAGVSLLWISYVILKQIFHYFFKKSNWPKITDSKKQN